MPAELDLYGVYFPRLLLLMLITFVISILIRKVLGRMGFYALVWHRGLFDVALYVVLLGGVSSITRWFFA
ncbi:DUF1656 domain-containing protein [Allorhizobium terrae]|uniref:DUF1656 domain-containing protein n=1 Tax=Allorhizobium terrae TaxID=1848972 RepID=A0A4S3ZS17_9HYPH|nr:DUF1656 domain-containing protein [Allorhizobium terrae]THF48329.1 DUF1656 domain-containing protein [Allorhizobium terrae]TWD51154.1 uncharacterized protein DUF1656 [Agrobacterium vitis]